VSTRPVDTIEVELPNCIPHDPALIDEFWSHLGKTGQSVPKHAEINIQSYPNKHAEISPHNTSMPNWTTEFLSIDPILQPQETSGLHATARNRSLPDLKEMRRTKALKEKARKSLEGRRLKLRSDQRKLLDDAFNHDPYPTLATRNILAGQVGMIEKQVRSWFNNARSRRPCQCKCLRSIYEAPSDSFASSSCSSQRSQAW